MASFVDLPLQVKDGGIYWQRLSSSSVAAAAPSEEEEEGEEAAPHPTPPAAGAPGGVVEGEFCFWHRDRDFQWRLDSPWCDLAHGLLLEGEGGSGSRSPTTKIKESALVQLVQDLGGDVTCAQHVCRISNANRPKVRAPQLSPPMILQQLVFPPITGLFYALDPDRYAANSVVGNGNLTYQNRDGTPVAHWEIQPDAAVMLSRKHLVLAVLALRKRGSHNDGGGMEKFVLMSSASALALVREGGLASVTLPMVVNDEGELAYLYTVTVTKDHECPVVELILVADLSDASETAEMVATLAVILQALLWSLTASPVAERFRFNLDLVPGASSSSSRSRSASESSRQSTQSKSSSGAQRSPSDEDTSEPSTKRARVDRGGAESAAGAAVAAAEVAACEGQVMNVRPFCVRARHKESDEDTEPGGPPIYFVGVYKRTNAPVFIKVWRGYSDAQIRRDVESEIRLLKVANQHRVPCPKVVDPCTALDVNAVVHSHDKYHRLVMHKLPDDPVLRKDVLPFAVSFIEGVLKLHAAGIVHCDIKPNNVVWNAPAQRASLVDFGHAQEIHHAQPYTGTVGYTAPEVVNQSSPHGPISEAYSVGRTLAYVCDRAHHSKEQDVVRDVAEKLSRNDPTTRITLQRALEELQVPNATRSRSRDRKLPHQYPLELVEFHASDDLGRNPYARRKYP